MRPPTLTRGLLQSEAEPRELSAEFVAHCAGFRFPVFWTSCHFPCAGSSCSASAAGAFAWLGSCCAWPPPRGGHPEVVPARLKPSHSAMDVGGVCNFLGSVSLQQKFEVMD